MDAFVIEGNARLSGAVHINGSKNAALPLLAAALLTPDPVILEDVPDLADIRNMFRLLERLGIKVEHEANASGKGLSVRCTTVDQTASHAPYDIVRTMRASICVLGPLLASRGEARVSMPGGCSIGDRPIDLHLKGLRALGAEITFEGGDVIARAPGGRLKGGPVFLGGPFGSTVLGTANVLCAAALATGETVIESAACEPEIADLAVLLTSMGAQISGAGTPRITIKGVEQLSGATHRVIPDRIEAGTYLIAGAITNSPLEITNFPGDALVAAIDTLDKAGVGIEVIDAGNPGSLRQHIRVLPTRRISPVQLTTQPHPGFPTDLQAQMMALLSLADGNSIITERIFEQRFLHVAELTRMGARLHRQGPTVVASGVPELVGAPVMASDLRASACLVLAGLAARGQTVIRRVYHLDRGYQRMEETLNALGACVQRVSDQELDD